MKTEKKSVDHILTSAEDLMAKKLYERSMIEFSKAIKMDANVTLRYLEGIFEQCEANGDYNGVIAVGSNILKQQKSANLANMLGNAYRKMGNPQGALQMYKNALSVDKKSQISAYNIAATMANVELYDHAAKSAISNFEKLTFFQLPEIENLEDELMAIQKKISAENQLIKQEPVTEVLNSSTDETTTNAPHSSEETQEETFPEEESVFEIVPKKIFNYIRKNYKASDPTGLHLLHALAFYCLRNEHAEIAWRSLSKLAFQNPQDLDLKAFGAISYYSRGKKEEALGQLVGLLGENPHNRYANVNLGYMYRLEKNLLLSRKYFLITQKLLQKSQGYYDMKAFRAMGDKYYESRLYPKALEVYRVLAEEEETLDLMNRTGYIHLRLGQYDDAFATFNRSRSLAPDNEDTRQFLKELNEEFLTHANMAISKNKHAQAIKFLENSLSIQRTKETAQRLLEMAERLKNYEKIKHYKELLNTIENEKRLRQLEEDRQKSIETAQKLEKQRQPFKAINEYENAFRMKLDKEIFLKLVELYKKTKQSSRVADLTERFNKMAEYERKVAQFEEEQRRKERIRLEDGVEETEEES